MDEKGRNKSNKITKRSRSRDRQYKKHKKHRKLSKSSRKYSSDSSHNSNSSLNKKDNFDNKLSKLREKTQNNKRERNSEPFTSNPEIKLPNKSILANIIKDNIKTNQKLDTEELNRATIQLKSVDSKRTPVLMTSHINSSLTRDKFSYELQDGEFVKLPKDYSCEINKCKEKFACLFKLVEHMRTFHSDQTSTN